jgi:hypothetical protein
MVDVQNCEVDALALLSNGLGLLSIVGFPWLQHIQSLADVTMVTKAYTEIKLN